MAISKKIRESLRNLPDSAKAEVLDFIEFLKSKHGGKHGEDERWGQFSLRSAMRGIPEQEEPDYSSNDIVESI